MFEAYAGEALDIKRRILFEVDIDETSYSRTIYTALDFLGDVGGLLDALKYIAYVFMWLMQGDAIATLLLVKLFRFKNKKEDINQAI